MGRRLYAGLGRTVGHDATYSALAAAFAIHEFASEGSTAFVVTELVDGETLRARLAGGALPARRAVGYALQIARGIGAAHARGIVHRDLKPEAADRVHD